MFGVSQVPVSSMVKPMTVLLNLMPAVLVWMLITMPAIAWYLPDIRHSERLEPLPRILRALFWLVAHLWPYSKICEMAEWLSQTEADRRSQRQRSLAEWMLTPVGIATRLPSRLDLGLPPLSVAEAEAWMAVHTEGSSL